ncbi:hypothetical protein [Legionella feeleii]|uniref:Gamma-glutamylcyclotransferase AIG2-like domain-containing protein n=1 Tax=Legionella feeleii TaxID=453 RepID=A0A0W0TI04_9GAMM|nr:hypothetical protein [Legionella feeleii]KTC95239.1 hypothetical protein Lfee_2903 [Legionella feeleii]SPX62226.1 Uncharacterised protein [Legionella feeleii]
MLFLNQTRPVLLLLFSTLILSSCFKQAVKEEPLLAGNCRPPFNNKLPQFVIGYGSLMQEDSKREDAAGVGKNYPVYISGFERGWIEQGSKVGFSTTYLGIRKRAGSEMNAVYFKLNGAKALHNYDRRENTYCRVAVAREKIRPLITKSLPRGQYWIYTTQSLQPPSHHDPIVQSYVDIFLRGCFELEQQYHLHHFAKDCIRTTAYWSGHWVNDRVYPRTAFDNIPYVNKIDPLLAKELPQYFSQIKIE